LSPADQGLSFDRIVTHAECCPTLAGSLVFRVSRARWVGRGSGRPANPAASPRSTAGAARGALVCFASLYDFLIADPDDCPLAWNGFTLDGASTTARATSRMTGDFGPFSFGMEGEKNKDAVALSNFAEFPLPQGVSANALKATLQQHQRHCRSDVYIRKRNILLRMGIYSIRQSERRLSQRLYSDRQLPGRGRFRKLDGLYGTQDLESVLDGGKICGPGRS
jgi:hypothetical protein